MPRVAASQGHGRPRPSRRPFDGYILGLRFADLWSLTFRTSRRQQVRMGRRAKATSWGGQRGVGGRDCDDFALEPRTAPDPAEAQLIERVLGGYGTAGGDGDQQGKAHGCGTIIQQACGLNQHTQAPLNIHFAKGSDDGDGISGGDQDAKQRRADPAPAD